MQLSVEEEIEVLKAQIQDYEDEHKNINRIIFNRLDSIEESRKRQKELEVLSEALQKLLNDLSCLGQKMSPPDQDMYQIAKQD